MTTIIYGEDDQTTMRWMQPECEICRTGMPAAFYESADPTVDFYAHDSCYLRRKWETDRPRHRAHGLVAVGKCEQCGETREHKLDAYLLATGKRKLLCEDCAKEVKLYEW